MDSKVLVGRKSLRPRRREMSSLNWFGILGGAWKKPDVELDGIREGGDEVEGAGNKSDVF